MHIFKPEFLNVIDDTVVLFAPLSIEVVKQIVALT